MKSLTIAQKAYIAGFIDNEGCITITRFHSRSKLWEYDFVDLLIVGNANKKILEYLRNLTGVGNISKVKKNEIFSASNKWVIAAGSCKKLLKEMKPFMIRQRKIVEMVLDFPFICSGGGDHKRTAEQYLAQVNAYEKIHNFNRRDCNIIT